MAYHTLLVHLDSGPTCAARIEIDSEIRSFTSANVVARVTGSDPALSNEVVVFTAHWDHLGRNPALVGDQIYNGVNDNAAGVAELDHRELASLAPCAHQVSGKHCARASARW